MVKFCRLLQGAPKTIPGALKFETSPSIDTSPPIFDAKKGGLSSREFAQICLDEN